jgi:hypothetical protein
MGAECVRKRCGLSKVWRFAPWSLTAARRPNSAIIKLHISKGNDELGQPMILYHFTSFYNLKNVGPENIVAVGLRPGQNSWKDWVDMMEPVPPPVVWFTANPSPTGVFGKNGNEHNSEVRITAVIPSSDRKLVSWMTYLRRHDRQLLEYLRTYNAKVREGLSDYYLYFGHVPSARIERIAYADPKARAAMTEPAGPVPTACPAWQPPIYR